MAPDFRAVSLEKGLSESRMFVGDPMDPMSRKARPLLHGKHGLAGLDFHEDLIKEG